VFGLLYPLSFILEAEVVEAFGTVELVRFVEG
jgi:hypothetical protein